jgi:glucose/arabinose dehydrogenase/mono/diheme cytochrome c family protein
MNSRFRSFCLIFMVTVFAACADAAPAAKKKKKAAAPAPSPWANWVEADFPFFSSVLDARVEGDDLLKNNITPRGLILNLGNDCWACFDTDLLRVSAIWKGKGVTPDALAPKSYHPDGTKTRGGQNPLPRPDGKVWIANGIYPGWQTGGTISLKDPRSPAPSLEEVGRGPLAETQGRFKAVRQFGDGVVLEYTAAGTLVREWMRTSMADGKLVVERHFELASSDTPLLLALGKTGPGEVILVASAGRRNLGRLTKQNSIWVAQIAASKSPARFAIVHTQSGHAPPVALPKIPSTAPETRWPEEVVTIASLSKSKASYVVDNIALPHKNPWKRNMRPADIQFLKDGTGVATTLDGDVWLARGLRDSMKEIRWKRFASGLHEPMTCAIRDEQIYVFDKNGIWRLLDTNGDGEADVHELFSNAFGQTADMREFPSTIRLAPKGEFVIAKGGQQSATLGKHNGSVLRVSADGRKSTLLGYGFRQPAIGVNQRTGLVTSGDQQGQYIPSTPLHIVRDGQFYGFLSDGLHERERYPSPPADPLTWMPHSVNASAMSQVWLFGAKMGALNDQLVHIGFTRPEVFRILMNNRGPKPQASVVSVTTEFQFPPLNGSVNPADGQLYIAGFQVAGWGNALNKLSGMGRVRYTGAEVTLPREVTPMDKGVLLSFDVALNPKKARDPNSYSLASWHYERTHKYGSAQYKADGKPGLDWLTASAAYLSKDRRSVFVAVPEMKPVMQMRIGWSLATSAGANFERNAYTTPYSLAQFDPTAEGFGDIAIDLTPRIAAKQAAGPVTVEEGRRLYGLMGCVACHSTSGMDVAKVGPTWTGLFNSERPVVIKKKKTTAKADVAYLRESILDPTAKVVKGFEKGEYAMPSYAGVMSDSQIESLILFIKAVKDGDPEAVAAAKGKKEDPSSFE